MSEITRYSLFAGVRTDMAGEFMEYKDHAAVLATHATALATVQAEHRIALQQRDQVTKELEEARAKLQLAEQCARYESDVAGNAIADMKAANAQLAAAEQRIAELEQCAAFVQWVRQEWHHDGDIDGGALQDALTERGLLTPTEVHAPCDPEACQCAEYGEFPVVCYRWADAARQEAAP